jgi:hypothetical protein
VGQPRGGELAPGFYAGGRIDSPGVDIARVELRVVNGLTVEDDTGGGVALFVTNQTVDLSAIVALLDPSGNELATHRAFPDLLNQPLDALADARCTHDPRLSARKPSSATNLGVRDGESGRLTRLCGGCCVPLLYDPFVVARAEGPASAAREVVGQARGRVLSRHAMLL